MKKTFKQILAEVPSKGSVKLTDDTVLPYVFDLQWDCKRGSDLKTFKLLENETVKRTLREHGF